MAADTTPSAKEQFLQRCRDMDLKTARQAQSVLCDELGISKGTASVYFHTYRKSQGIAKRRPHKKGGMIEHRND